MGIVKKLTPFEKLYPHAADVLAVVRAMSKCRTLNGQPIYPSLDMVLKAQRLMEVISKCLT